MKLNNIDIKFFYENLLETKDWHPFADISDRKFWDKIKQQKNLQKTITHILKEAKKCNMEDIPRLYASEYMRFIDDGDREGYETICFKKRSNFSFLVLAECLENKGTYLSKIYDYFWSSIGEPTWCIPAHNFANLHDMILFKKENPWKNDDPLPLHDDDYLDLFACETGAILAEACYILKPALMAHVPSLYHRVNHEIEQRIIKKVEGNHQYGWYRGLNNWTPWCSFNVLNISMYILDDNQRLLDIILKLIQNVSRFLDHNHKLGSCIEGAAYWARSAPVLAGFLDLIEKRTQTSLRLYEDEKISNIYKHIEKIQINNALYVNFADSSPQVWIPHGLVWIAADQIRSKSLKSLILNDLASKHPPIDKRPMETWFLTYSLRLLNQIKDQPQTDLILDKEVWLKDIEIMVLRETSSLAKGLTLSAIAGNNNEQFNHHNHNDMGHFNIAIDGAPVIIDIGAGDYRKETFTTGRYEKWFINSLGHNVPMINNILQKEHKDVKALNVLFETKDDKTSLSFDMSNAYSGVTNVFRKITYERKTNMVTIKDSIKQDGSIKVLHPLYLSQRAVDIIDDKQVIIACEDKKLQLISEGIFVKDIEKITISDKRQKAVWGSHVHRIMLEAKGEKTLSYILKFNPISV